MKSKQFKIITFLTAMVMAVVINFSISIRNPALAVASFLVA